MRCRKPAIRRTMLVAALLLGLAVAAFALAAIDAAAMPIEDEGTMSSGQAGPEASAELSFTDATLAEPVVDGLLDQAYIFVKYYTMTEGSQDGADFLAPGSLYSAEGVTECYWAFVVDRGFNSNVYADNDQGYLDQDGWAGHGHTFKSLERSDHAEFNVTYNNTTFNIPWIDYINAETNGPAYTHEYASGEQTDSFGSGILSPPLSAAATSLHWNLLNSNWDGGVWGDELVHTPPYTYNWTGNYWEWNLIYEFSIPRAMMGGQCGLVEQAGAHNSPSKQLQDMGFIGDKVWEDLDEDGIQDPDEPGVSGVLVYLIDADDGTIIRTTQTNPEGWYIFNNLPGGNYIVEFVLPDGYQFTAQDQGDDDAADSDADPTTGRTETIVLAPGTAQMTWDAGIYPLGASIDIEKYVSVDGGQTWHDADDPTGPYAKVGSDVTFRFVVSNTGYVTLTDVDLSDSIFDLSGCSVTSPLPPAGSFECIVGPVSAMLGQHENTATASGIYNAEPYTDSDPAHYLGLDVRLDLEPEEDVNAVGDDHVFTATLEMNDGTGWTALSGEQIDFTRSGVGTLSAGMCTTDGSGQCNVTLSSDVAGTTLVTATFDGVVSTVSFTVSDGASKDWLDVRLDLYPPEDVNAVGDEHVFTATLEMNDGTGWTALAGAQIDFTKSGVGTLSAATCTTDGSGQCNVMLSSDVAGTTLVTATFDGVVSTVSFTVSDGASKGWLDVRLELYPPEDVNAVGDDHVFTATLEMNDGTGWTALAGEQIDFTKSGVGTLSAAACTTDGSGQCNVTLSSDVAGTTQVTATFDGLVEGLSFTVSDDAEKMWIDASISIAPETATNPVGQEHIFTITVLQHDESGTQAVPDVSPVVSVVPSPDSYDDSDCVNGTDASGQCTVVINSASAGEFTANATITLSIDGYDLVRSTSGYSGPAGSGPAIKTYVDSSITVVKDAVPDSEQQFEFVSNFTDPFLLTDDGSGSNWVTFDGLSPGTYVITETQPEGWDLDSIVCSGADYAIDFPAGLVTVTLGVDEDATCTFTNLEQQPAPPFVGIEVIKDVEPYQVEPLVPFTYTVEVRNTSWESTFDPLVLTDTLPTADFHYVAGSAMVGGAAYEPDVVNEPLLVWNNLGSLAAGDSITVTFAVTVPVGTEGTYTNTAVAAGHYVIEGEPGVITDEDDAPVYIEPTAVTLLYFWAEPLDSAVQLEWRTAAELNNVGYYIYRAETPQFEDASLVTYVDAKGSGSTYEYTDEDVEPGTLYWYWLVDVDVNGIQTRSYPVSAQVPAASGQHKIYMPLICSGW